MNRDGEGTTHVDAAVTTPVDPLRHAIQRAFLADETACVRRLLDRARAGDAAHTRIFERARRLVLAVRARRREVGGLDAFLHEYDLATDEGVALMCLAEALLRIPDAGTADRLIREKLGGARWEKHLGHSESILVNASTWGLMLTGRLVTLDPAAVADVGTLLARLAARSGEPMVRQALRQAMRIIAQQFVMGDTIEAAVRRARSEARPYERFSFDMLGEAALCAADVDRYQNAYAHAIEKLGAGQQADADPMTAPGISVKLSALHPRFEFAQRERVLRELTPRLRALALKARAAGVGLTLDAEEADRLEPLLDVFSIVWHDPALGEWDGLGLAVQAYQKRALPVLEWLASQARAARRRIPVRLVKGAYWDTEIKRAQERGLPGYPVFTRKAATDVSYLACARYLLQHRDAFYSQLATHNAHTIAGVIEFAGHGGGFEFQRLHGMGESLYAALSKQEHGCFCRVYAPVGAYADLLPYLVRRLLENGANTSFVNRILDAAAPVEQVAADPVARLRATEPIPHTRIPLPRDQYGAWLNSQGINLDDAGSMATLTRDIAVAARTEWIAGPVINGRTRLHRARPVKNPADRAQVIGRAADASVRDVERALASAVRAQPGWDAVAPARRREVLERAADLIEAQRAELMSLLIREAGKCIPDALAEVRETADYCRYYAWLAEREFGTPARLPAPAGERNALAWRGRGVFVCISPWNFPLAIFTGQVSAALAAGNAAIAKPAPQTPLVAARVVRLLHQAGVPEQTLHLLPGAGATVGARLVRDPRVGGVVFTGSTETAQTINRQLAARAGPIVRLIAETGGQNCMIADSSALPEQVVKDALHSAFNSAGQRCSALRVLWLQKEIAPRVIALLRGAMAELCLGDPMQLSTDIGPVIDAKAKTVLTHHARRMERLGRLIYRTSLPTGAKHGSYFAPCAFEVPNLKALKREVFGPILHVVRYAAHKLDAVIEVVNATGYGLTLGVHSRVEATARYIQERVRVGNVYVNRNMIGAVVGVQPFGGEGLSGTGPKAGGPHYLHGFAVERTVSVNTAAVGGNASLLSLADDQAET